MLNIDGENSVEGSSQPLTTPRDLMFVEHADSALRRLVELDSPSLVVVFDWRTRSVYCSSEQLAMLSDENREYLKASIVTFLDSKLG